jgi:chromosome partitioning protein
VVSEVRQHFGEKVYDTVIPRNVRISEAPSFGQPVIFYDPTSKGAEAYRAFAAEFARRTAPAVHAAQPPAPAPAAPVVAEPIPPPPAQP